VVRKVDAGWNVLIHDDKKGDDMSEHTYKIIELVGSSPDGSDAAIRNAIERASKTVKNLDWFEVVETRGHIVNGAIAHFQVTLKAGFRLEE